MNKSKDLDSMGDSMTFVLLHGGLFRWLWVLMGKTWLWAVLCVCLEQRHLGTLGMMFTAPNAFIYSFLVWWMFGLHWCWLTLVGMDNVLDPCKPTTGYYWLPFQHCMLFNKVSLQNRIYFWTWRSISLFFIFFLFRCNTDMVKLSYVSPADDFTGRR